MNKKNNGRRKRRHSSTQNSQQRKNSKITFSPDKELTSQEIDSNEETDKSLRLTLIRHRENESYSISQTSTPLRVDKQAKDKSLSPDISLTPQAINASTMASPIISSGEEHKSVISDNEFKNLVVNKLSMIESNISQLSNCLMQLSSVVTKHTVDLDELRLSLDTQIAEVVTIKKQQSEIGKQILKSQKNSNAEHIILKNLCQKDWSNEKILTEVNKLLKTLDVKAPDILDATKIGSSNVLKITLGPGHTIGDVLKVKRELKNSKTYEKIYIDKEKSVSEQKTEASLRAIAYVTPGLTFYRGQLQAGNRLNNINNGRPNDRNTVNTAMNRVNRGGLGEVIVNAAVNRGGLGDLIVHQRDNQE